MKVTNTSNIKDRTFAPGHYRPQADSNHFVGRCWECDAHYMRGMTLDEVENWYHQGMLTQDELQAYHYVWATSAVRFGDYGRWTAEPDTPEVQQIVDLMQSLLEVKS